MDEPTPDAERWLPVVGYERYYVVSDRGRVRRIEGQNAGRLLRPGLRRDGYLGVTLCARPRRPRHWLLHRVVAMAHLGLPPSSEHEVNHIDRDRANPRVSNLEWVTRLENVRHSIALGVRRPRGEEKVGHKLTWTIVREIRSSTEGARALGRRYGVHHTIVLDVRAGRKWRESGEIERTLCGHLGEAT